MIIKRGLNTIATVGVPLQSSNYSKALMGDEKITLVWEAPAFVAFQIGDYVVYEGANFTLNQLPTVKKISSKKWQYNAVFESTQYDLAKVMYLLFDNTATPPQGEFTITGNALTFMQLLLANLERAMPAASWSLGEVVENTDYKTLTFTNESCHSVIARLAQEFDTEYHIQNRTINLKRLSTEREITLEYGTTLYDIERASVDSSSVVTRLYPTGAKTNLAFDYRGGNSPLRLPAASGNYIESNVNLFGIIEQAKTFDDIYPRLSSGGAGVVTAVGDMLTFTDAALDFNVNDYLQDGAPAKVHFNTGQCAGYEFEISNFNNSTKTFKIIANKQQNDFTLPTAAIKPAVGDKYVLLDVVMPPAYLANAEAELLARAQEYLTANASPKVSYRATFSSIYAKQNLQNIECGDTVLVYDADMGINEQIRITKLQRGISDFWNVQFDLSNTVTSTRLERIAGELASIQNSVVVSNDRINRNNLRAHQNTKELQGMIFDPDGYFDPENIKPLSIETTMLSVGAKSQSFQLSTLLQPNSAGNPQVLAWGAGLLTHFTIVDDAIKEWTISQGSITISGGNQSLALYIYARCNRTGTTGDIYLAPVALKFDEGSTYYYFLIGVLHTPIDNVRGISLTYGQSTINGGFIKTGVISSIDGATYFNLNTGEIGGNIKFRSGGTLKSVEQGFTDAATDATNKVNAVQVGGRNLILNSKINEDSNVYGFGTRTLTLNAGEQYVFSVNGNAANAQNGRYLAVYVFIPGWLWALPQISITSAANMTKSVTFTAPVTGVYQITTYYYDHNEPRTGSVRLNWYKLEKGNKATDWTPAPEDAETAINAINSTLSDFANDNKLTADEKQTVKKEWDAITGEYGKLIAQADSLSVSRAVYAGLYSALNSYLNVTIISPNTQPLLANLNTTSDIVGSTFRNNFTNYYNARTDLQNALTAKVQTNLSNTKPAGKNYLVGSRTDNLTGWFLDGGTATVVADAKYKNVVEYSRPAGGGNYMKTFQIERSELKNTELVYYCIAKPISANPVFAFGGWSETVGHLNQNSSFRDLGDGWRLYFRVFNAGGEIASSGTLGLNSVGGTWRFHSFGVCKGNQPPADWEAAPEDTQAQINAANYLKTAIAQVTEVNGGLVLAAALCARDTNGQVRAYLNGLAQKAYAVAAGVSGWGTAQESAKSWIDFLGNAKFGNLRIGVNGEGKTWIEDQNGVTRFQFSVENIEALASLLNAAGQSTNVTVQSFTTYDAGEYTLAQTITVNADDSELTLSGGITAVAQATVPDIAECTAVLRLYRNGVLYTTITDAWATTEDGSNASVDAVFNTKLIGVPAGVYSLRLYVQMFKFGSSASCQGQTSNISLFAFKSNDNRAMVFGADGLSLFWDQYKYFHIKNGVYTSRGAWDIPAGLGGATISSAGGISAKWGKISTDNQISKSGSEYTITHNLGDSNYSVVLTPTSTSVPYIKPNTKGNNSVVLVCAGGFDFIIIRTQ